MKNQVTESDKLKRWKKRLEDARDKYGDDRTRFKRYADYYNGTRNVSADPNTAKDPSKLATNVRNIVYELIESQVDSSIPMPKVRAMHAEDDQLAKKIERMLENKIKTCGLVKVNDIMERNVPTLGGDYFHVQWDVNAGLHSQVGDIRVSEVHPKKLIPQPGVIDFENMDYFFIQELLTKTTVRRQYCVDVEDAENDDDILAGYVEDGSTSGDLVTVNTAYYHNDHGGVGVYIWCDTYELLDMEDFESRYLERCAKCGAVMRDGVCPECGGKKSKKMPEEYEELVDAIEVEMDFKGEDGKRKKKRIEPFEEQEVPMLDEAGNPIMDEQGQPQMQIKRSKKKVPYYKPDCYPIILRKNITANDRLLGDSDTKAIIDQQDTIKKLGTKINEKLLKGGSYVTLPNNKKVETNDKELKIIRVDNAAEKALIDVINVQPNVGNDENYLEINYQWAKSTLGITDSFQGKFMSSETSGTARQYAINQAAGRLESKRTLKNEAFAQLYKLMFKFWLAYADQNTEISSTDPSGQAMYEELDRHEFLRIDKAGEFYWNDEFVFDTDPTSTLMQNREMMWQQTDLKLQSGAFGPVGDLETSRAYWTIQKANGYPNAGMVLDIIENRIQEQQAMAQQQAMMAQQMPPEGAPNAMPGM
jgi:predicted  nucleic acid-binding Zn-ribbon protein